MKLRRKSSRPIPRQRLRQDLAAPPRAFSYHARRDERTEETARKQQSVSPRPRSHSRFNRISVRVGLGVAVLLALLLLNLSTAVKVRLLGNNQTAIVPVNSQAVAQAAQSQLEQSLLNRNKLTVNTQQLSQNLQQQFSSVESLNISIPFIGNQLLLSVVPAQPTVILAAVNGMYALDRQGKALAPETVYTAAKLHVPTITDQSNFAVEPNKQALTPSQIQFIQIITHQLAAKQVAYSRLVLPPSASELDVYISGEPYYVKFNLQTDTAREQAGTFLAVRQSLAGQHITPAQYIDVRVEGRAYYR